MQRDILKNIREHRPVVHCITNYVTANDVANVLLACGASAVMASAPCEVAEITARAQALVLNLGTMTETTPLAMERAGKEANDKGIPVVLDPVGLGGSAFRKETAARLLREVRFTLIRGNASELKALCGQEVGGIGLDAMPYDMLAEEEKKVDFCKQLSRKTGAIIVMTGATDLVSDGKRMYRIANGCAQMSRLTGSGCMLDGLLGAFLTQAEDKTEGAVLAVAAMGLCGQMAAEKMEETAGGMGSFHMYLLDAVTKIDDKRLKEGMRLALE